MLAAAYIFVELPGLTLIVVMYQQARDSVLWKHCSHFDLKIF